MRTRSDDTKRMPHLGRTRIFAAARCRTINSLTPLSALASMELPHSTCHESKLSQSALSLCRSAAAPGRASKAMNKRTCTPSAVSFSLPSWAALEALSRAPCCQTPLPIAWVPRQHKNLQSQQLRVAVRKSSSCRQETACAALRRSRPCWACHLARCAMQHLADGYRACPIHNLQKGTRTARPAFAVHELLQNDDYRLGLVAVMPAAQSGSQAHLKRRVCGQGVRFWTSLSESSSSSGASS